MVVNCTVLNRLDSQRVPFALHLCARDFCDSAISQDEVITRKAWAYIARVLGNPNNFDNLAY